jgi:hypothetical protein
MSMEVGSATGGGGKNNLASILLFSWLVDTSELVPSGLEVISEGTLVLPPSWGSEDMYLLAV